MYTSWIPIFLSFIKVPELSTNFRILSFWNTLTSILSTFLYLILRSLFKIFLTLNVDKFDKLGSRLMLLVIISTLNSHLSLVFTNRLTFSICPVVILFIRWLIIQLFSIAFPKIWTSQNVLNSYNFLFRKSKRRAYWRDRPGIYNKFIWELRFINHNLSTLV